MKRVELKGKKNIIPHITDTQRAKIECLQQAYKVRNWGARGNK